MNNMVSSWRGSYVLKIYSLSPRYVVRIYGFIYSFYWFIYSLVCLLDLHSHCIQYVQLKNGLLEVEDLREMIEIKELWFTLTLPDSAPQCKRIRSTSSDKKVDRRIKQRGFVKSAKNLYRKYLCPTVAFMKVNVSKELEKEIVAAYDSLDETLQPFELVLPLLDRAAIEVSEELKDTFTRFRGTDVFKKLEEARITGIPASFEDQKERRIL